MSVLKFLPRFREAYAAIDELAQRESWKRSRIEEFQLKRLNSVWKHAYKTVDYYRETKKAERLPDRFRDLEEFRATVPPLKKATVRRTPQRFLSDEASPGEWYRTGGSTGEPTSVYRSKRAHLSDLRNRYCWLSQNGIDLFDRQATVWGHAASFTPGLKGLIERARDPLEDWLRNRLRLSAYALGPRELDLYLQQIARFKPRSLYGYSSALFVLARRAIETGFQVDEIRMSILTGEPALPSYADAIRQAFHGKAMIEYGAVETGILAMEDSQGDLRIREDSRIVETLPRPDGRFDIAVTVLDNPSFPLFRYLIGDLTGKPVCTREIGFSVLEDIRGRDNDFLVSRNGKLVHSMAVKHALEEFADVGRFQALQRDDGSLCVVVELHPNKPRLDEQRIIGQLASLLQGYPVAVKRVDRIPGNRAGKHSWVVSTLYQNRSSGSDDRPIGLREGH